MIEAMVKDADPYPPILTTERYTNVRKYAVRFLRTFIFAHRDGTIHARRRIGTQAVQSDR
ncbi:hypothetical protein [Mesorhizobium sp.]|uniref:hypothetical protein n=1 Tax=Mesorhizobium sp. TaxID=1871066 RepID=UPI0025BCBEF8|nr:hypothetical protein [Mesorhizobium sp.]